MIENPRNITAWKETHKIDIHQDRSNVKSAHLKFTNLGLHNFVAKGDGTFLVIAQRVSAAFACTSGELWTESRGHQISFH